MKSAHPVKTLRSFRSRSTSRTERRRCLEWPLCATSGHSITTHYALAEHARFAQERQLIGGPAANPAANFERRPVSGDPTSSEADIQMTKAIIGNATPLGRAVHDHIIVGKNGYANLKGPLLI